MTRHFFITMGLTASILIVGLAIFYQLVLISLLFGVSPFWSIPPMLAIYAAITWRPIKSLILRFNR